MDITTIGDTARVQAVQIDVFNGERYDGDWPADEYPGKLVDVIAWFQAKLLEVPEQYRKDVCCNITSVGSYEDSHYPSIEIWYYRPETADETAKRLARDRAAADRARAEELATLKALQAKYPKGAL